MSYEFQLHPDLNILQQYNYISATPEDLEYAIQHNHGEAVCLDFIPRNVTREEFVENFLDVVEAYELMEYVNTLFYISLREVLDFDNVINHAQDTYQSKKQAKQLAQLLRCFHETPPGRLQGLKLNTLTETVKVSDDKLISWIGGLIKKAMENGEFSYGQLGEGAWHLLDLGTNGFTFPQPLNYDRISVIADKTVRSPNLVIKRQLAYCLHRIWRFIDNETTLQRENDVRYADRQLEFLFKLGKVLGWLNEDMIASEPKDYMYALFSNYIRY